MILAPLAFAGSIAIAFLNTYLSADFYESDAFQDAIYDTLISEVSYQLHNENPDVSELFTFEDIKENLETVVPPEMIGDTISSLFEQINENPFPEEVVISTDTIKKNLPTAVDNLLEEIDDPMIKEHFDSSIIDYIPNSIPIDFSNIDEGERFAITFLLQKQGVITQILVAAFAIFLIVIALLIWKPWNSIMAWQGWALVTCGTPILAFGMLLERSFEFADFSDGRLSSESITTLLAPFANEIVWHGVYITSAGFLAFILHFLLKHREASKSVL